MTQTQQAELRRVMGYPDLGKPSSSSPALASLASAWRFLDPVGQFEQRIQSLSTDGEVQIWGQESEFWGSYAPNQTPPGITWTDSKTGTTYNGYMPTLRVLESDVVNARRFRAFTKADVVDFNATEPEDRAALYNHFRQKLSDLLAMPLDPDIIPRRGRSSFRRR